MARGLVQGAILDQSNRSPTQLFQGPAPSQPSKGSAASVSSHVSLRTCGMLSRALTRVERLPGPASDSGRGREGQSAGAADEGAQRRGGRGLERGEHAAGDE
eukprot:1383612-Rhodomonas_salina.2